jgi:hypothetical protein
MQHKEICGCDTCEWQDRRRVEEERLTALQEEAEREQEESQQRWQEYHRRKQERAWQEQYQQEQEERQQLQEQEQGQCSWRDYAERYTQRVQQHFLPQHEQEQEQEQEQEEEQQLPSCSSYLRRCDADRCTYECAAACGSSPPAEQQQQPVGNAYPLPPIESCLYGCSFSCGAKLGEECIAQFDEEGDQLPALVRNVVETAIESDDDMPALVSFRPCYNPEEETEIVEPKAAPAKPPKAKPLFPYNHPRWPSPRAKALVRSILGKRATEVLGVKTLTHDACMRYLAKYYRLSHEQLLETSVYTLHNPDPHTPYYYRCKCTFCAKGYHYNY